VLCVVDIEHSIQKAVFGVPLRDHLEHTGGEVSIVIEQCVMALLRHGLNEEVSTDTLLTCLLTSCWLPSQN